MRHLILYEEFDPFVSRDDYENYKLRREKRRKEQLDLSREQKGLIEKYIDILQNHPDKVKDTGYENKNNGYYFHLTFDDDTNIKCSSYGVDGNIMILKINNQIMSRAKDKIQNLELDPYGEDDWNIGPTPYDTLGKLVRKYALEK